MQFITLARHRTCTRIAQFIKAAGKANVSILSFTEGTVSGYPWFNWWTRTYDMGENERINQLFSLNSVQVGHDGGHLKPVLQCAKEAGVNVVLPVNDRIRIFAMTAAHEPTTPVRPATALYAPDLAKAPAARR